jgi:hypothetical protein
MRRFVWSFVVGLVLGAAASACAGAASACSQTTCAGCCSSEGKCQTGVEPLACGVDGEACARCGPGTACARGTCVGTGSTGGGAGSTGGGAGSTGGGTGSTGGGSGSGCRQVATFSTTNVLLAAYWSFTQSPGHYNVIRFVQAGQGALDGLGIELPYPNDVVDPTPPFTFALTSAGYFQCKVCSVFYEACDQNMQCAKTYLARSGSVSISQADRAEAGRIAGAASNLRFIEWDLGKDQAVTNGGCIEVGTVPAFSVRFDGGVPVP